MTDIFTPEQRHIVMSHIRSKDTRPELLVRRFLHRHGIRYSLHVKQLPGHPDIVLRKYHTIILVNGCFWHGHGFNSNLLPLQHENPQCSFFRLPYTNTDFWQKKIERNICRDEKQHKELTEMGWNVITIWECQLRSAERENTLFGLLRTLNQILMKNMGVHFTYHTDEEDDTMPRAAESDSAIESN
ncbi:MAG: DNA mismatch endonuclease Vsr [Bacteroidaceae bacterium]|nr:DNA mismatch endonuclease Vsr [Bacteroidaceae bacterium]